jgi:hypothetical protein
MSSRLAGRLLLGLFGFAMVTLAWGPIAGLAALAAFGLFVLALMRWAPAARRNRSPGGRPPQGPRPQGPRPQGPRAR